LKTISQADVCAYITGSSQHHKQRRILGSSSSSTDSSITTMASEKSYIMIKVQQMILRLLVPS
jgi:hypothetical protein